jgi:hypothetical protein
MTLAARFLLAIVAVRNVAAISAETIVAVVAVSYGFVTMDGAIVAQSERARGAHNRVIAAI